MLFLFLKNPHNSAGLSQLEMHLLYITASVPRSIQASVFLRKSPRALLERFTGFNNVLNTPEWTRWTHPILEFQQPRASFADLFVRMATWEGNKDEGCYLPIFVSAHLNAKTGWTSVSYGAMGLLYYGERLRHSGYCSLIFKTGFVFQSKSNLVTRRFQPTTPHNIELMTK